jgi:cytochrome c553
MQIDEVFSRRTRWLICGFAAALILPDTPSTRSLHGQESANATQTEADQRQHFEKQIRPLLAEHCWSCHGPESAESELRLDSLDGLLEGGSRGPAVVPGQPEKSLMISAVNHADRLQMPPKLKLPPAEVAVLVNWVRDGAYWPDARAVEKPERVRKVTPDVLRDEDRQFWAFQPVRRAPLPEVQDASWARGPSDMFIRQRLEQEQLSPVAAADSATLLRRAAFDLLGLPPAPDDRDDFWKDPEQDRFDRLLDRLLASPRYGERWGRHWLDIARYGDSNGLDENLAFANAFRYRDYVVRSLNRDKPYDQFVREQIAGDLIFDPAATTEATAVQSDPFDPLIATGFLALGAKMLAEDDPLKMQMDIVDEQVDTVGKAFMGLTLGCARCHDHKYDPLSMSDYYALAGIFKSTKTMENFSVVAKWQERPLATPDQIAQLSQIQTRIDSQQKKLDQQIAALNQEILAEVRKHSDAYLLAAAAQIWQERTRRSIGTVLGIAATPQPTTPAVEPAAGSATTVQVVEAESYQRGNALKHFQGYGEGIGVILSNGNGGWHAEYDLSVPEAGWYQLEVRYAAAASRPTELSINGKLVRSDALREVTGSWNPDTQKWHVEGVFELQSGMNLVRLSRFEPLPHIDKILIAKVDRVLDVAALFAAESATVAPDDKPASIELKAAFVDQWRRRLEKAEAESEGPLKDWGAWLVTSKRPDFRATEESARGLAALAAQTGRRLVATEQQWQELLATAASEQAAVPKELPDADGESYRKLLYNSMPGSPLATPSTIEEYYAAPLKESIRRDRDELQQLRQSLPKLPETMAVAEGTLEDLPIHLRGNHTSLGKERIPRRFPRILDTDSPSTLTPSQSGRLDLARWLTRSDHPLTSRVVVNRIWIGHFGDGLVRSADNFGRLGDRPSHPELLDWLAQRLLDRGWSLKSLHRELMQSATYQLSAENHAAAQLRDPDNRWHWHHARRRLEAEAIRDSILAVADTLDLRMEGSLLPTANRAYVTSTANVNPQIYDSPRRTIYLPVVRSALYDVLQAFDFAEPSVLNGKRDATTVAPQALFMLNSTVVAEQARAVASQLMRQPSQHDPQRLEWLYQKVLGRAPRERERTAATHFLQVYATNLERSEPDLSNDARSLRVWQAVCRSLIASNEFVYVD